MCGRVSSFRSDLRLRITKLEMVKGAGRNLITCSVKLRNGTVKKVPKSTVYQCRKTSSEFKDISELENCCSDAQ